MAENFTIFTPAPLGPRCRITPPEADRSSDLAQARTLFLSGGYVIKDEVTIASDRHLADMLIPGDLVVNHATGQMQVVTETAISEIPGGIAGVFGLTAPELTSGSADYRIQTRALTQMAGILFGIGSACPDDPFEALRAGSPVRLMPRQLTHLLMRVASAAGIENLKAERRGMSQGFELRADDLIVMIEPVNNAA